jgi:erythronate-4-phosphate dehydrogenase
LPEKTTILLDGTGLTQEEILSKAVLETYDIRTDDVAFRKNPELFEKLRGDYPVRREFPVYTIQSTHIEEQILEVLKKLGFNFKTFQTK